MAGLPAIKTLDQYDYDFAVGAPKKQIDELASLRFIDRGEQLPPGVQGSLLEDAVDEDLVEIEAQLAALTPRPIGRPNPRSSPSAQHCPRSCPASRSATNRTMPIAPAVAD